ncbi:MAG: hypothetical protein JJE09_06660 [Bacteroidia bacterium]|nr:hypothetical protein [Bacteroidia bacterium]
MAPCVVRLSPQQNPPSCYVLLSAMKVKALCPANLQYTGWNFTYNSMVKAVNSGLSQIYTILTDELRKANQNVTGTSSITKLN